jgi:hypothetical protein
MPTTRPRLTITLDRPTYEAIAGLAKVRSCSKNQVISETMDAVAPVLERIATLIQTAQDATQDNLTVLKASAEQVENELTARLGNSIDQLDMLLDGAKKAKPPVQ